VKQLSIDIETYSSVDLASSGVYAYAASPDFEILLVGYAYGEGPVELLDLASGEEWPEDLLQDLTDPGVAKLAFNAAFERTCLSAALHELMPPEQWYCTQVLSAVHGLPRSLEEAGRELGIEGDKAKLMSGKALIHHFCRPCAPTARNGYRERNLPMWDPDKWKLFREYCRRDVEAERELRRRLEVGWITPSERRLWCVDQRINDRGVLVDLPLVHNAIRMNNDMTRRLETEAVQLTGLDNPKSVSQLKAWLEKESGEAVETLRKDDIPGLIAGSDSGSVRRVLEIRQELSRSSVKKYEAMARSVCPDGRIRGLLQFYGASRTGRWAGRIVQVQNLPQNHMTDLALARELVRDGDAETIDLVYPSSGEVLKQLLRTALIPQPGKVFLVADFSAIEARVIAWLAGEEWRLDVFRSHGKIYEASAARMFRVPIESITKGSPMRQKGKVAELACGYGGAKGALINMGALEMGLSEDELPALIQEWRAANPAIVQLWADVESAAIRTVETGKPCAMYDRRLVFTLEDGALWIRLPSLRALAYRAPEVRRGRFGGKALTYAGAKQTSRTWSRIDTHGGKLVENIVQAIARDCLADALIRAHDAGFQIVMHVHDEIVAESDDPDRLNSLTELMGAPIPWAQDLPLRADGYVCGYYCKD